MNQGFRQSLSNKPVPPPVDIEPEPKRLPLPVVIGGIIAFVVIGIMWTAHRHATRDAGADGNATLNDINNQGEEQRRARDAAKTQHAKPSTTLPASITMEELRALIEASPFFQEDLTILVPKSFIARDYGETTKKYTALASASKEGLVEFEPPTWSPKSDEVIEVHTPSAAFYKIAGVNDRGDTLEIDLGTRKLDSVFVQSATDSRIDVQFSYSRSTEAANDMKTDGRTNNGRASLTHGADGWMLDSLTRQ